MSTLILSLRRCEEYLKYFILRLKKKKKVNSKGESKHVFKTMSGPWGVKPWAHVG